MNCLIFFKDTGMAMKALCEYTTKSRLRDVSSLTITVEASSLPGMTNMFYVTDKNLAQLQTLEVNSSCYFLTDITLHYIFNSTCP